MNREVGHFLTPDQQASLRGVKGEALDLMIDMLRRENPEAFHSEKTLCQRVFFNQPISAAVVYDRFVVAAPMDTFYGWPMSFIPPVKPRKKRP